MPFTKEELEEMARADAEIEENFRMTQEEAEASRERDVLALASRGPTDSLRRAQRAYYQRNREKLIKQNAARNKERYWADPEAARAKLKAYYKKNRERILTQNRVRRMAKKEALIAARQAENSILT